MANTTETLVDILSLLERRKVRCDVFGGWAEEFLGLSLPRLHSDIDLIYRDESFETLDAAIVALGATVAEVPAKRFKHKRAFIFHETLCEILLVKNATVAPFTNYWGDIPFFWDQPLLDPVSFTLHDRFIKLVSADNLRKHRDRKKEMQPHRWCDPASLDTPRTT